MIFIDYRIAVKSKTGKTESFYVNTFYGDHVEVDGNSWFLYVGLKSVCCGDLSGLADKGERNGCHYYGYVETKEAFLI